MRILIINTTYDIGSTGKLTRSFRNYLIGKGNDVLVLFGRGKKKTEESLVRITSPTISKITNAVERVTGLNKMSLIPRRWRGERNKQ